MIVVTPEEMRRIDQRAIQEFNIPGLILMENAALQVIRLINELYRPCKHDRILVLAGGGNNGGDGLAIARHLFLQGLHVNVILLEAIDNLPRDAGVNLSIIDKLNISRLSLLGEHQLPLFRDKMNRATLIIDAIFGTGLSRPVEGLIRTVIDEVNDSGLPVIAVDIPSGINGGTGHVMGSAIKAKDTVALGYPKRGHVLFPGRDYSGRLHVVPISLPLNSGEALNIKGFTLNTREAATFLRERPKDGHKGSFGKAIVVAGSLGMTGAAFLASVAAIRGGAGLVTLGIPSSLNAILESKTTEVMTFPLEDKGSGSLKLDCMDQLYQLLEGEKVLAIGPGLGRSSEIREILWNIFGKIDISIVLDADGLNNISEDIMSLKGHSKPVIITPHPGEMARLTGETIERITAFPGEIALELSHKLGIIVLLKGGATVVAGPDGRIYFNQSGNSGMATGGSGDVLTGLIASFVAQGYEPYDSAVLGSFIHGRAGELTALEKGEAGMVAGDILEAIPLALKEGFRIKLEV